MTLRALSVPVLACCISFACKEKAAEPTTAETPSTTSVEVRQPAMLPRDPPKLEAPTQEDFEEEVERTISSKNLNEELDKLERELDAKLERELSAP